LKRKQNRKNKDEERQDAPLIKKTGSNGGGMGCFWSWWTTGIWGN